MERKLCKLKAEAIDSTAEYNYARLMASVLSWGVNKYTVFQYTSIWFKMLEPNIHIQKINVFSQAFAWPER